MSTRKGLWYDEADGQFHTKRLSIRLDFAANDVEVRGPQAFIDEALDIEKAVRTASLFMAHVPSAGWAVAHAIHGQFSAWIGGRELLAVGCEG